MTSGLVGETQRAGPVAGPRRARSTGSIVLWIVAAAWAVILLLILRNAVFVSDDAISNYGHVWYVSDRIWRLDHIPWSMPVIGHRPEQLARRHEVLAVPQEPTRRLRHHLPHVRPRMAHERTPTPPPN